MCPAALPAFLTQGDPFNDRDRPAPNVHKVDVAGRQPSLHEVDLNASYLFRLNGDTLKPVCCPAGLGVPDLLLEIGYSVST